MLGSTAPSTGDNHKSKGSRDIAFIYKLLQDNFRPSEIALRIHSANNDDNPLLAFDCLIESVRRKLQDAQIVESETILSNLEIDFNTDHLPYTLLDETIFNLRDLLNSRDESQCQNALSEICQSGDYGLIDTHNGKQYCCGSPKDVLTHQTAIPLNGKIDLVSSRGPLFLEIKGRSISDRSQEMTTTEFNIIGQVLERIYLLRCCYGQLSKIVCFSATSADARCYVYRRVKRDKFEETLDIWKIKHDDIFKIWGSVVATVSKEPQWFLTSDAPFINSCLMRLGYHPSICGVKLEKSSSGSRHHVYHIHFPEFCTSLAGVTVLAIPRTSNRICIKVHNSITCDYDNDYSREAAIISKINQYQKDKTNIYSPSSFYAHYCLPYLPSSEFSALETTTFVENQLTFGAISARFEESLDSKTPTAPSSTLETVTPYSFLLVTIKVGTEV